MVNGSMDSRGGAPVHGSSNIVGGAHSNRTVNFHQHVYSGGPNDPGVFGSWLLLVLSGPAVCGY